MTLKQKALLVGIRTFFCDVDESHEIVESWEHDATTFVVEYRNQGCIWGPHENTDADVLIECVEAIARDIFEIVLGEEWS